MSEKGKVNSKAALSSLGSLGSLAAAATAGKVQWPSGLHCSVRERPGSKSDSSRPFCPRRSL